MIGYRLCVLSHGEAGPLERTLASFRAHVRPDPLDCHVFVDGTAHRRRPYLELGPLSGIPISMSEGIGQRGFCAASRHLWSEALIGGDHDHVFWLEHDFEFLRQVDLTDVARVLDTHHPVAQMSLMRGPANEAELAAGGLVAMHRDRMTERFALAGDRFTAGAWLEHQVYFTTNPSLMRRAFMRARRWPNYPEQCEGRFGLELVEAGYTFGVWGDGQPWVDHFGERTGSGY